MNTPSHLVITAALWRRLTRRWPIPLRPVLAGAVAPDVPLCVLSIGGYLYFTRVVGLTPHAAMQHMFGTLFFQNPWWIALHNTLHAPLLLGPACWILFQLRARRAQTAAWFFASCLLHAGIDLATHHDDGPLPFFPLDWHTRFLGPVSYWDPHFHGGEFAVFELGLDVVLLVYLAVTGYRSRRRS